MKFLSTCRLSFETVTDFPPFFIPMDLTNIFLFISAVPTVNITVPVVATGQSFRMSCNARAHGTLSYSWPQSGSGILDLEHKKKYLSFVSASKALATVPFSCQVTVVETGRVATANTHVVVLGKSWVQVIHRRIPLASPGLIHAHSPNLVGLYTGGLVHGWAYT